MSSVGNDDPARCHWQCGQRVSLSFSVRGARPCVGLRCLVLLSPRS